MKTSNQVNGLNFFRNMPWQGVADSDLSPIGEPALSINAEASEDFSSQLLSVFSKGIPWSGIKQKAEIEKNAEEAATDTIESDTDVSSRSLDFFASGIDWQGQGQRRLDDSLTNDEFSAGQEIDFIGSENEPATDYESLDEANKQPDIELYEEPGRPGSISGIDLALGVNIDGRQHLPITSQQFPAHAIQSPEAEEGLAKFENDAQRIGYVLLSSKNIRLLAKSTCLVFFIFILIGSWIDYHSYSTAIQIRSIPEMQSFLNSQHVYFWNFKAKSELSSMEDQYLDAFNEPADILSARQYIRYFPDGKYVDKAIDVLSSQEFLRGTIDE